MTPVEHRNILNDISISLMDARRITDRMVLYIHDHDGILVDFDKQEVAMRNAWTDTAALIDKYNRNLQTDFHLSSEMINAQLILINDFESAIFHYFYYYTAGIFEAARVFNEPEAMRLLTESAADFASAQDAIDNMHMFTSAHIQALDHELFKQANSSVLIIGTLAAIGFCVIIGLGITILVLINAKGNVPIKG